MSARQHLSFYGPALLVALILIAGLILVRAVGHFGEREEHDALFTTAATAAAALDPATIGELKGSSEDIGTPALQGVRESLKRIRQVNPEMRFVYLMRQQEGQFIFLADAEPEDSAAYSPPGQIYDDQVEGLLDVQESGLPLIEAPYKDRWGTWVSALAPVLDRSNGRPVAVLGMDINARRWERSVLRYRAFAVVISALFLGLVLVFLYSQRRQRSAVELQSALNDRLQNELAERAQLEERLLQMASVDSLTNISNRRIFDEALHREWGRALREQSPLSLVMADLDFFKRYNDHYGHVAGDDCLRHVATALAGCVQRSADVVARYGGEEFALVLPQTDAAGAAGIAERVVATISALGLPHADSDVAQVITISAGHATLIPKPEQSLRDLILLADGALYQAKRGGRNTVRGATLA